MQRGDFELLLPVGQKEMAEAAIHNGADAVYVGFPGWNARGRSYDFELEELRQIIELCHLYGVKVNLAFNIVIFENELEQVVAAIKNVLPLKPDALIVQDLGLVRIIKEICPDQVVHASTQMTVTNDLAISLLSDLGIRRFVLGRENSISEIQLIKQRTDRELEVFVHGALCVSYSGQCFTSESLGGRSANRGQCAQSCRFSYDLIVDGVKKEQVDRNYLVSPQDLCGLAEIPELMKSGVKSFKIEGRLKSPEYVAQAARSFSTAIAGAISDSSLSAAQVKKEMGKMEVEYSRGFFSGWLHGVDHQKLVRGDFSSHRGLEIGRIVGINAGKMRIKLNSADLDVENGDGLLWFSGKSKMGGSVFGVRKIGDELLVEFANSVKLSEIDGESQVYLNHDRSQKREIEKSMTDRQSKKRVPIRVRLTLKKGEPLSAQMTDGRFEVAARTEECLTEAQKKPITVDALFSEFSALGGGVFSLSPDDFAVDLPAGDNLFINHRSLKNLRQQLVEQLEHLRTVNKIEFIGETKINSEYEIRPQLSSLSASATPAFHVLLRNREQVDDLVAALRSGRLSLNEVNAISLDFEFGRDYESSLQALKAAGVKVGIATTRILKPQEYVNLKVIHRLNPDFILVRNLGALYFFTEVQKFDGELIGDFSLNVTNHKTFEYLTAKGLSSVCLSYDMNESQAASLLRRIDAGRAEMTVHQSMPSFHMEHCVFAAFLSQGSSYRDCGKPCERHRVQLKDQFGNHHWIKPDQECRNTMYNSAAQTAVTYMKEWQQLGLGTVRLEALHEQGEELIAKLRAYADVIAGRITPETALEALKTREVYGLSPRQLARSEEHQARKKDHAFL